MHRNNAKIQTMKKLTYILGLGAIIGLNSCGTADPKSYADAYCDCLKENKDPNGLEKANLDKCFEEVNTKVGKLKKDDIPTFRKHMGESECAVNGMK